MHTKSWSKTIEPTSYEQIYKYIEQTLDECSTFIDTIEIDYYQGTSASLIPTPKNQTTNRPLSVSTLLSWSNPLNELRDARLLHDIRNGKTIRELLSEARIGTLYGPISDESVVLMKRILDKTTEQFYSKIPKLTNKITDCTNLMEQYFLSFYDIENVQDIVQNKKKEKLPVSIKRYIRHKCTHDEKRDRTYHTVCSKTRVYRTLFVMS
jgi:hypothetical protein